jgi:hypothetical protein
MTRKGPIETGPELRDWNEPSTRRRRGWRSGSETETLALIREQLRERESDI